MNKIKWLILLAIIVLPLAAVQALTMQEAKYKGQILGDVTYAPVTITSPGNQSLKLFMTALGYENGKWKYSVNWNRTLKTREGTLLVSLKSDRNIVTFKKDPAAAVGEEILYLNPATRYRIEFYARPGFGGVVLLRKFFNSLPAPETEGFCTMEAKLCRDGQTYVGRSGPNCAFAECPPIAMCDYAAPREGCYYENGPSFNPITQCGKIMVCPNATSTPPAMCDYAAPAEGCSYENGPNFNPVTQCGKIMVCPTPTPSSVIKVISPNGGETWIRGSKHTITWQGSGNVNIELVSPRPSCLDAVPRCLMAERAPIRIASGVSGGSYEWTVNDSISGMSYNLTSSQYKIKITSTEPVACTRSIPPSCTTPASDESDNLFTMSTGPELCPQILCAAPPAGMCYVHEPNNVCGCGRLTTFCDR